MLTDSHVLDSMRHIIDPDLGKDIVSLGFIKNLQISGGDVSFTVELTTPACPVKEQFKADCKKAVSTIPGVSSVVVEMSAMHRLEDERRPSECAGAHHRLGRPPVGCGDVPYEPLFDACVRFPD